MSSEGLVGGCSYDTHGTPLTDATMAEAHGRRCRAARRGRRAEMGQRCRFEKKPERGLLRLRKDMGLFANLRPAIVLRRAGRCLVA